MTADKIYQESPDVQEYVFTRFITKNGKRIYHPNGGVFRFPKRNV